jgi:hypothetical protein
MHEKKFELCTWVPEDIQIIPEFLNVLDVAHQHPLTSHMDTFLWKHRDNPSGPSIITYAVDVDNGKVIAMEALSPRKLLFQGQVYMGYESNDTATHPDYWRRGLFTSLLKLGTDIAIQRNASFLYGFPNLNSKQGFLKHNWRDTGAITVLVRPVHLVKVGFAFLKGRKAIRDFISDMKKGAITDIDDQLLPKDLEEYFKIRESWINLWTGYRDKPILKWRFLEHPVHCYRIISVEKGFAFVNLGNRGILRECKIVEAYFRANKNETRKTIKNLLLQIKERFNPDMISTILTLGHPYYDAFIKAGFYKAPSDIMFFNYPLSGCPENSMESPWAIGGTDIDTQ